MTDLAGFFRPLLGLMGADINEEGPSFNPPTAAEEAIRKVRLSMGLYCHIIRASQWLMHGLGFVHELTFAFPCHIFFVVWISRCCGVCAQGFH